MLKKAIILTAIGSTMSVSTIFSPANALDPVQCQPTMDTVLYYATGVSGPIVGEEVTYCDGHVIFLGGPGEYSWTQYCGPCE
jgi:hypothetical protein